MGQFNILLFSYIILRFVKMLLLLCYSNICQIQLPSKNIDQTIKLVNYLSVTSLEVDQTLSTLLSKKCWISEKLKKKLLGIKSTQVENKFNTL